MEGSDAFGQAVEIGEGDDPFAGTDFGDFGEPPAEPTTELKTVDKEGNEVVGAPSHAPADAASVESQTGEAAAPNAEGTSPAVQTEPAAVAEGVQPDAEAAKREEDARRYREEKGEGEFAPPGAEVHRQIAQEAAERSTPPGVSPTHHMAGAERPRPTPQGAAAPVGDPTPPAASDGPTEAERREQEGDVPLDPTPGSSSPAPEAAASGEPQSGGSDEEAEPPVEPTDSSGKTTKRRYVVLKVVGPGKFEQVTWYEDGEGNMVPKGPGTKRQGIALARGAEDALKIGYVAAGSPPEGVNLVAVAQLHFQPKPVRPAAPKPSAVRLQIG
jgi:hypothetical protein